VMVIIDMRPMPPKAIEKVVYLWARSLFGPSKDLEPKRCPNTWRREGSKETRDSMNGRWRCAS
jgi:hypothetical protein